MSNDLSLDDLRVLRAVALAGGFRAGAARHGLSPSRVSEIVRRCEDRIGARLFERTSRSVRPSDLMTRLLRDAERPLAELEDLIASLGSDDDPAGTLRIGAPVAAGPLFLTALAADYLARYPAVALDLRFEDAPVDGVAEGLDLVVRSEVLLDADHHALPIGPEVQTALVAAPAYVARRGLPASPDEVPAHDGICFRIRGTDRLAPWSFALDSAGRVVRMPKLRAVVDSQPDVAALAGAGAGLALAYRGAVAGMIAAGALIDVLPERTAPLPRFHLAYRTRRHMAPSVRTFIDMAKRWRPVGTG